MQAFRQYSITDHGTTQVVFSVDGGSVLLYNMSTTDSIYLSYSAVANLNSDDIHSFIIVHQPLLLNITGC